MRNPIPACGFPSRIGGAGHEGCGRSGGKEASDYQFPPPGPDAARPSRLLGGFGAGECYVGTGAMSSDVNKCVGLLGRPNRDLTLATTFQFNIVDKVRIPDVEPGEYIMSFRWDGEQTNQIWSSCSDVTIVKSGPAPPTPPAPAPPAPAPPAPTTYKCQGAECIEASGGIAKDICEQVCLKEAIMV